MLLPLKAASHAHSDCCEKELGRRSSSSDSHCRFQIAGASLDLAKTRFTHNSVAGVSCSFYAGRLLGLVAESQCVSVSQDWQ